MFFVGDEPMEAAEDPRLSKLPPYDPLILFSDEKQTLIVPELLGRFLRPHQREGILYFVRIWFFLFTYLLSYDRCEVFI